MVTKLEKLETARVKAIYGNVQSSMQVAISHSQNKDVKVPKNKFDSETTMKDLADWARSLDELEVLERYKEEELKINHVVSLGFDIGKEVNGMSMTYEVTENDANKKLDDIFKNAVHFKDESKKLNYRDMTRLRIILNTTKPKK